VDETTCRLGRISIFGGYNRYAFPDEPDAVDR
jgi:hypothetical protein